MAGSIGKTILVVDDSRGARTEIVRNLKKEPDIGEIYEAVNGMEAIKIISNEKIDLVITDIVMPKMDGFKLIKNLVEDERFVHIPLILLTVRSRLADRVKGMELGAWDFLVKPVHPVELATRVRAMLRVKKLQDKLRDRLLQLENLSIIDGLTGLYNKTQLNKFLRQEVSRTKRFKYSLSCLMIDVDRFKQINDTYGHVKGDRILKDIGIMMNEMIRGYDFAARFGGDEFTLLLPQQAEKTGALILAERFREAVEKKKFLKEGKKASIRVTVSVGVATLHPGSRETGEELLERADKALYEAKNQGRNKVAAL